MDLSLLTKYALLFEYAYFDMDGLLSDLAKASNALYGAPPLDQMGLSEEQLREAEKDPIKYGLAPFLGKTDREVSDHILAQPPEFWESLGPLEDGVNLWFALQGTETKTRILTSPMHSGTAAHGKMLWCQKHLSMPGWGDHRMHITVLKEELSQPGRLLLDDSIDNVTEFRKRGGAAFWWPHDLVLATAADYLDFISSGKRLREHACLHVLERIQCGEPTPIPGDKP